MPQASQNSIRADFAQRLKACRNARGFGTARAFAQALGIDENRYTRYERHEVEPDLGLLARMSTVLGVTPNDLLGFPGHVSAVPASGFGEDPPDTDGLTNAHNASPRDSDTRTCARSLAWQLACRLCQEAVSEGADADPRNSLRRTSEMFTEIERDPFGFATRAADDPALAALPTERQAEAIVTMNEMLAKLGGAGP